jgi:phage baseplate assembly protein gpV/phage protein D
MKSSALAPSVEIAVGGAVLDGITLASLASIRVARRLSQPAQCEVAFVLDGPNAADLPGMLGIGSTLEITVSEDTGPLFSGDITGKEWVHQADGYAELRVRAYDGLHRLRKHQKVMARTDVGVSALASELAGDAGIGVEADEDGPTWPVLMQHRQSDLDLLAEVAERAGLWFAVIDGTLRLFSLGGVDEPAELKLRDTLLAASFDATAEPACSSVAASGWDPVAAVGLDGDADGPRNAPDVGVDVSPGTVSADGERKLVDRHGPSSEHLDAAAQAELDRRAARGVVLRGTAEGDAYLQPGRRVLVLDAAPELEGTYVLTATDHTLDANGYLVELSTEPPAPRPTEDATVATLATVTSADDPDGLGRVTVKLSGYEDVETDWRQVVSVGAGAGKGLVAVPDVDDRVLVLLPHGDPAAAIVVGGLYGDDAPYDPGIDGGAVRRWSVQTGGGQRVILDDSANKVTVANKDGSAVVMTPDKMTVHAKCDLTIEAPGKTMTLRANRIELNQATSPEDGPVPAAEGNG